MGIGMDMVDIQRIARAVENSRLVDRVYTSREAAYCRTQTGAASFAVRFAAKEAFLKALGTGLADGIRGHDVEVVRAENGRPSIAVSGRAGEIMEERGISVAHVTLTHTATTAAATVVLEKLPENV